MSKVTKSVTDLYYEKREYLELDKQARARMILASRRGDQDTANKERANSIAAYKMACNVEQEITRIIWEQ